MSELTATNCLEALDQFMELISDTDLVTIDLAKALRDRLVRIHKIKDASYAMVGVPIFGEEELVRIVLATDDEFMNCRNKNCAVKWLMIVPKVMHPQGTWFCPRCGSLITFIRDKPTSPETVSAKNAQIEQD